jgi:glycerol-3-phosphate acyltransferase PlsY
MTNLSYILFVLNGFVLGSIPFGYIISKLSKSKDITEIGWKKSSGSNVLKNVGKWEGVLTILLDGLKGFLSVYIPTLAGCPPLVIALCGTAAIVGHNWSPLLGFKGGRGIATLAGAALFISPAVTAVLIIICGLFALLWTASIGTIIAIILGITISFADVGLWGLSLLLILSILPISIKRLSPIKEIIPFEEHKELIENRLIFDQDEIPPFRIRNSLRTVVVDNNISNANSREGEFDFINAQTTPSSIVTEEKKSRNRKKPAKKDMEESKKEKKVSHVKSKKEIVVKKDSPKKIKESKKLTVKKPLSPKKPAKDTTTKTSKAPTRKSKAITPKTSGKSIKKTKKAV